MSTSPGLVTFLFTEVEGATLLWEEHPADVEPALVRHDEILRAAFAGHGGRVIAAGGDGFAVAFDEPQDAVDAALEAQRGLAAEPWPGAVRLLSRMGVETGAAQERHGNYLGPTPKRAARIMAAAHGGQVLVGARTASLLEAPELVDLGEHRLPDLPRAERLFQVQVEGARSQFQAPRTRVGYRGNLPMPTTSLIGRDGLLGDVVDLVGTNRLVTLTGVGGVGKTRLAIEVGSSLAADYPDGVWMVELAPLTDAAAVPEAIATTLGITHRAGEPIVGTVAEALSGRRVLIVLDNCEHVAEAVATTVGELLARSTTFRVLATSREALDVPGEHRRLVLPLTLDGGVSSPAVTLFVERARALQSRIDFAETVTAAAVVEICRSLDGLPLGIELAAARTISMSPIDIRDRLGDRFRLLTSSQHAPRRQQTLRDVVAWSYELLDDDERSLLRQVAVFQGGFELAAITEVLGGTDESDVLDVIDSLVRKSLVVVDDSFAGTARYALLETIRQFAEDELAATGSLDAVRDRHAEFFAAEAVARWTRWNGPSWRDCVDWLGAELANLRAAFRWSWSRGNVETATDIAAHAAWMGASVQLFETVGWAQEILDDATVADVHHLPRLYASAAWGCFTGRSAEAVLAAQTAGRLEAESRYEPYEPGLSGLIEALAQVYAGHLDRYVEAAERVVSLGGRAQAWGLSLLLDGLQASGRVDEALAMTDAAMAAARSLGNPYFIAYAYWTTGGAWSKADPDRALAVWRDGLDYVHQHGVDFFVGFIARDAARLHLVDADPDIALTMFDAAVDAFQQAGNRAQLTITLASATALFERIDRLGAAATLHNAISRQPGTHHVPDLPERAERLALKLGDDAFGVSAGAGGEMDLNDAARYALGEIRQAQVELREDAARRQTRPGGLSAREVDVLRLVANGLTTREIAERLFISAKTADRHIQNTYTKIGLSNRAAATRWAMEHGLLD